MSKTIIQIDDAGWGNPLGGVLIGAANAETSAFVSKEISIAYFKEGFFEEQNYLEEAAKLSVENLRCSGVDNRSFKIHLCPGYIHSKTEKLLRRMGYKVIRTEIKEPLQTLLEQEYRKYILQMTGVDLYYDPKVMGKTEIAAAYRKTISFIESHNMWDLAKTGWGSLRKYAYIRRRNIAKDYTDLKREEMSYSDIIDNRRSFLKDKLV